MTRATKEECGCTHDGQRWLTECSDHKKANDAHHARAMAEHRGERNPQLAAYVPPAADWLDIPNPSTFGIPDTASPT